jgi:hypothetical protein
VTDPQHCLVGRCLYCSFFARIAQEETEEMDEEMLKERESGIMELGNK